VLFRFNDPDVLNDWKEIVEAALESAAMKDISRGSPPQPHQDDVQWPNGPTAAMRRGMIPSCQVEHGHVGSDESPGGGSDSNALQTSRIWLDRSPSRMDTSPKPGDSAEPSASARRTTERSQQPILQSSNTSTHESGNSSTHDSTPQSSRRHRARVRVRSSEQSVDSDHSPHSDECRSDEKVSRKRSSERKLHGCCIDNDDVSQGPPHCSDKALDAWAMHQLSTHGTKERRTMVAPLADSSNAYHSSIAAAVPRGRAPFSQSNISSFNSSNEFNSSGMHSPKRRSFVPFPALAEENTLPVRRPDQQVRDYKARTLGCTSDADRIRALSDVLKTISPRYDDQPQRMVSMANIASMSSSMADLASQPKMCMPHPPRSGGYLDRPAPMLGHHRTSNCAVLAGFPA
jgi:hypothetical protein